MLSDSAHSSAVSSYTPGIWHCLQIYHTRVLDCLGLVHESRHVLGWCFVFFPPELPTAHAGSSPDTFFPDISASQVTTLSPLSPSPESAS